MNYDNLKNYDIIIIGSGMSGLYSAYYIKQNFPNISFIILEKFKKEWIGGRTSNSTFYGTQIVTGAGIGRRDTNPLLIQLMNELNVPFKVFHSIMYYSQMFSPLDIVKVLKQLKQKYKKHPELHNKTFKQFFIQLFGEKMYKQFLISSGYTDFENADLYETIYNYGMDDNMGGWDGLHIQWKQIVDKLYHVIGKEHFKFSCDVVKINRIKEENPCLFEIITKNGVVFNSNKVIIATTISSIQKLVHVNSTLYQQIHGQPFLRLYGKFNKQSSEIMKKYVPNYTIVPGPLQKIIPMNSKKGVYMIAYSDNSNAIILKNHLDNTPENRKLYCQLIEKSLGIPDGSLSLIAIKDYYWPIGTHYYKPLSKEFSNRSQFLDKVQHPEKGMLVVGEAVSTYQGWTEGALESVKTVLTKKWVLDKC
uniref:Amine oxidase domain-containing protein n=1 Tax=viral metagenome TaxID=1070528 RepID=A0A6C0ASF1_9ZZZZ